MDGDTAQGTPPVQMPNHDGKLRLTLHRHHGIETNPSGVE